MQILITNDDGYAAPGLAAMYRVAREFGNVTVAAPAVCHSSKGHAVFTSAPIKVTKHQLPNLGSVYAVHSTPADSVRIGAEHLMPAQPDLVLAGINPGANLGVDVYYSGTVAAAREAAIMGLPAMAVSVFMKRGIELKWNVQVELAREAIKQLLAQPVASGQFWNVNFPAVETAAAAGAMQFTRQSTEPQGVSFEPEPERTAFRFTGNYAERPASQPSDVRSVFSGHISSTLLQLDTSVELPENE